MRKRHTIEERIQAVRMCQRGHSADHVSRELGIKGHYVREWVERYRMYGMEGLEKQPSQGLGFEEKCKIVLEYREKRSTFAPRKRPIQSVAERHIEMGQDGGGWRI